jgi:hypothetical protein
MKHKLRARSLKFSTFMPRMLNRKRNRINSIAKLLLALFLFTFAVSQAVLIAQTKFNRRGVIVSQSKTTSPTSQSPFEKTEKEEKHAEDKSVYFLMLVESGFLTLAEDEYSFYTDPNSCGNSAQVPLYLLIRTLLI